MKQKNKKYREQLIDKMKKIGDWDKIYFFGALTPDGEWIIIKHSDEDHNWFKNYNGKKMIVEDIHYKDGNRRITTEYKKPDDD